MHMDCHFSKRLESRFKEAAENVEQHVMERTWRHKAYAKPCSKLLACFNALACLDALDQRVMSRVKGAHKSSPVNGLCFC